MHQPVWVPVARENDLHLLHTLFMAVTVIDIPENQHILEVEAVFVAVGRPAV